MIETMPAPATDPAGRDPATIASPIQYGPGTPVWIYRAGSWRPGRVECSSALAATVRYRPSQIPGTLVDTAIAPDLAARNEFDLPPTAVGGCQLMVPGRPTDCSGPVTDSCRNLRDATECPAAKPKDST